MNWKFLAAWMSMTVALWASDPSAEEILAAARMNPLGHEVALNAQLRAGSVKVPFTIEVRDGAVRYLFENPSEEIQLRLTEDASILEEIKSGKTNPVAQLDDAVRGGLITFEDLALKFLYWKNPKLLGTETVRTREAWKIEVLAPPDSSQYGAVRVWIDKASTALLRIEGYDREGKLAKRFEVVSAQKIDGQWMLKQMRVERIDPATRKTKGITYLEVLGTRKS
ncbi:MAG: outer membrane lipoprotein-sorting protein [Verrucomicrobiota bacterium]